MRTSETTLNPQHFAQTIRRSPTFLEEMPSPQVFQELPIDMRRERFQRAMASSALSIAEKLEQSKGESDLNANLYKLVGNLGTFYESNQTIDELRNTYGSPRNMSPKEKDVFYNNKRGVIEFNHILHEVINVASARYSFDQLLTFMTTMHIASGGDRNSAREFDIEARQTLIGMRNEMAFEQVLIAGGIEYEPGSIKDDEQGGDFTIENVPIDVKASESATEQAREKARREGRDPNAIIWSHIKFTDYNGRLTLPYDATTSILADVKPDLDTAILSHRQRTA